MTSIIETSEYQCYTKAMNSFNQPNVSCPCNVACYEKSYTSAVTVSTWPSNQYWVKKKGFEAHTECNQSISSSPNLQIDFALGMDYSKETLEADGPKRDMIKSQIQEDYAKADIYFQSLNVQTIAQEKKYSVQPVKQL